MTSLKCWNSGVESNGAAFILSPVECGYVSRDSGAYGKEGSSSSLLKLARQFFVGHTPSNNLFHDCGKAFGVRSFPVVAPKRLFVKIPEQVEGLNTDVGAVQATLQKTPEVFHRVGVNVAVNVLDGVVDDLVLIVGIQTVIGEQFIAEDGRASFDALADCALKFFLTASLNVVNNNLPATLNHSEHNFFPVRPATLNFFYSLALVHVPRLAADKGFIDFDFASELVKTLVLHCQTNPVKHEPRGLLGDAEPAMDLIGRDSVLATDEHPCCAEPLLKRNRRVLEDRISLEREGRTEMSGIALPNTCLREPSKFFGPASWASDFAVRPPQFNHELTAMLEVREPQNRVSESVWRFHVSSMHSILRNVKYVIAINSAQAL
jgi:hypothetical protein